MTHTWRAVLDCPEARWTQPQASAVRTESKTCDPSALWLAGLFNNVISSSHNTSAALVLLTSYRGEIQAWWPWVICSGSQRPWVEERGPACRRACLRTPALSTALGRRPCLRTGRPRGRAVGSLRVLWAPGLRDATGLLDENHSTFGLW